MARVRIHAHALRGCGTTASRSKASTSNSHGNGNGNGKIEMDSGFRRNDGSAWPRGCNRAKRHGRAGSAPATLRRSPSRHP